jgi:hypothetical protein
MKLIYMKKLFFITIAILFVNAIHAQMIWVNETIFSGFVGKYEIKMKLGVPYGGGSECLVIGEYYYMRDKGKIALRSTEEGRIVERDKGKASGYFILNGDWNKNVGQAITGYWYSLLNSRSYPVLLKVIAKGKY